MRQKLIEHLPVPGGDYQIARWAGTSTCLLAIHGITASHMAWPSVVDCLGGDYTILAPDLRGRGANNALPAPYGLKAHVTDLLATLDHYRIDQCIVTGHSLGAYIALELVTAAPDRINGLVLVDGGLALPLREGTTPEHVIAGVLGPALKRLDMRFADRAAYHVFWRQHPAFQDPGAWNPYVEAYVDYDLTGTPPEMVPKVNREAVRVDAYGPLDPTMVTLIDRVQKPMRLLTAPRGLLNQAQPLLPLHAIADKCARLPQLHHVEIADTNHYSIVTGSGRTEVARHLDEFVAAFG